MTFAMDMPAKPDRAGGCARVSFETINGMRRLTIRWWRSGEDEALGRSLVYWGALVVFSCAFGELLRVLTVVSLAMLLVSNGEEIGEETDANNRRDYGKRKGCATSDYDLTWKEQRGMRGGGEKGGCLRGVVRESDPRKIKKTPKSPERGKNEESSPSTPP